ncbi:polyadenylate-binding protein-interacting protein 1-like [Episyrphus balteatus]|uniref:polyadenylate-binding protein-interacting protein 1-like n=1 Tax=Episyrphus balteatus TaxID=286459 RepID=UPI002484DD0F|nr:polyadenylate-binding protein-interacting protein 1-like [Episyrphus balteatus]
MEPSPGRAPFDVDDDFTPLRKPHTREIKKATLTTSTPPRSLSKLSPTAQVFVPKSKDDNSVYQSGSPQRPVTPAQIIIQPNSVNNRLLRIQHPEVYAAAVNCNSNQPNMASLTCSLQKSFSIQDKSQSDLNSNYLQPTDVETIALNYLATVIQCLNDNPGSFDTVATRFLTIFDGLENNEYVLSNAMEDIFNESIENPNFRYMGAKLYNLLHMLNLRDDSLFYNLLKCKLEYQQSEVMDFMKVNSEQKVRETALFLAELYMQLRGDDTRIKLIAENIVFSLKQLMTKVSNDNIRCICLTLKLAGYDLDSDFKNDVNLIMEKLAAINKDKPGKYPLVKNVISLKNNNWGRTMFQENTNTLSQVNDLNGEALNEPTFYGPDGKIMTKEESQFLAASLPKTPSTTEDDDEYDLEVDLDPEMDEETEKAYRTFCKLNKKSTTI